MDSVEENKPGPSGIDPKSSTKAAGSSRTSPMQVVVSSERKMPPQGSTTSQEKPPQHVPSVSQRKQSLHTSFATPKSHSNIRRISGPELAGSTSKSSPRKAQSMSSGASPRKKTPTVSGTFAKPHPITRSASKPSLSPRLSTIGTTRLNTAAVKTHATRLSTATSKSKLLKTVSGQKMTPGLSFSSPMEQDTESPATSGKKLTEDSTGALPKSITRLGKPKPTPSIPIPKSARSHTRRATPRPLPLSMEDIWPEPRPVLFTYTEKDAQKPSTSSSGLSRTSEPKPRSTTAANIRKPSSPIDIPKASRDERTFSDPAWRRRKPSTSLEPAGMELMQILSYSPDTSQEPESPLGPPASPDDVFPESQASPDEAVPECEANPGEAVPECEASPEEAVPECESDASTRSPTPTESSWLTLPPVPISKSPKKSLKTLIKIWPKMDIPESARLPVPSQEPPTYTFDKGCLVENRWKIVRKIGFGAFGKVYKAFDNELDKHIALKVIHKDLFLVEKEAAFLKVLHNVNYFCEYIAHGRLPPHHAYLATTLKGPSLLDLQQAYHGMSLETIVILGMKMLNIIIYMHQEGFIHGDIKASNFVIGLHPMESNEVFLIDFDSAGYITRPRSEQSTIPYTLTRFLGRKDDLWAFLHMILDLRSDYTGYSDNMYMITVTTESRSLDAPIKSKLGPEFIKFREHVAGLRMDDAPDYNMLKKCFRRIKRRLKIMDLAPLEWQRDPKGLKTAMKYAVESKKK